MSDEINFVLKVPRELLKIARARLEFSKLEADKTAIKTVARDYLKYLVIEQHMGAGLEDLLIVFMEFEFENFASEVINELLAQEDIEELIK